MGQSDLLRLFQQPARAFSAEVGTASAQKNATKSRNLEHDPIQSNGIML
jgi:hypothetical protein